MKKPRTTTKHRHKAVDGHISGPSGKTPPPLGGARSGHEVKQLSRITFERARSSPKPLAVRGAKFRQNFTGQVKVPRVIDPKRGGRHIDVGQVPED